MTIKLEGELEIDTKRGVVYFHNKNTGTTVLRICRLNIPDGFNPTSFDNANAIDITEPKLVSYYGGVR